MGGFIAKLAALELAAVQLPSSDLESYGNKSYLLSGFVVAVVQSAFEEINHQINPYGYATLSGVIDNVLPIPFVYLLSSSPEFALISGVVFVCEDLS